MITFNLEIFEDVLQNREELIVVLRDTPLQEKILLDTQGEGPSLRQCGLIKLLEETDIDLSRIRVNTPNLYEELPVQRRPLPGKFNYWFKAVYRVYTNYKVKELAQNHHRLGCFIGRKNLDRLAILYWLSRRSNVFLSSLHEDHINYEQRSDIEQWVDNIHSFESWVNNFNIPSIDHYQVKDQYRSIDLDVPNSNYLEVQLNMLNWYNGFDVEIVCETFVRGDTYFATEKTTRPIAGGKPMLVYGPKNYLKNLQNQGFKTWASCWDESYDQYEGVERWERMKAVIEKISNTSTDQWNAVRDQANQIAKQNQQYFITEVAKVLDYYNPDEVLESETLYNGWDDEGYPINLYVQVLLKNLSPRNSLIIDNTMYTDEFHKHVMKRINEVQPDKVVVFSLFDASVVNQELLNRPIYELGYYDSPYFIDFWAHVVRDKFELPQDEELLDHLAIQTPYLSYNRKPHAHRLELYNSLVDREIVDFGIVSMNNLKVLEQDISIPDSQAPAEDFKNPNDILSLGRTDLWCSSFLNVVTETWFDINKVHFVSEKIYKPIVGLRPFFVYAEDMGIKWLHDRGFKTYEEDFKDIYDTVTQDNLVDFLTVLCQQDRNWLQAKFVSLMPKLIYNRERFYKYVEENNIDNIVNEILTD